jgi:hypothetical protein
VKHQIAINVSGCPCGFTDPGVSIDDNNNGSMIRIRTGRRIQRIPMKTFGEAVITKNLIIVQSGMFANVSHQRRITFAN